MTPQELKKHLDDRTAWRSPDTGRESDRYLISQALEYITRLESDLESLRNRYIESRKP